MATSELLLGATAAYLLILAVTVYFTRPIWRRFMGAAAGGGVVAIVGVGVESLFQTLGFWYYPDAADRPYGPEVMYPLVVVMWTILALVGWRIMRRYGWRGHFIFLTVLAIVGSLRDYLVAEQALGILKLTPGISTVIIDMACWAGTTALAQAVMRVIAGSANADRLAVRRWPRTRR